MTGSGSFVWYAQINLSSQSHSIRFYLDLVSLCSTVHLSCNVPHSVIDLGAGYGARKVSVGSFLEDSANPATTSVLFLVPKFTSMNL